MWPWDYWARWGAIFWRAADSPEALDPDWERDGWSSLRVIEGTAVRVIQERPRPTLRLAAKDGRRV